MIWALFARVGHSGVVQIALSQSTAPSSFPRDVFGSSRSIPASFGADKSAHGKSLRKKLGERPLFAQWQPQPPLAAAAMLVSTMFTSHCSCLLNSLCAFSTSSATHRLLRAVANNRTCFTPLSLHNAAVDLPIEVRRAAHLAWPIKQHCLEAGCSCLLCKLTDG